MLNKVILIGRLGQNPELSYTQSGMPFARFSVATDESYTDKEGNRRQNTEWHRVVVWSKQAEFCANYLSKGRLVYVEGSLQTRKWQDQQGQEHTSVDIRAQRVLSLERMKNEGYVNDGQEPPAQSYQQAPRQNASARPPRDNYGAPSQPSPSESTLDKPPYGDNFDGPYEGGNDTVPF